MTFQALVMVLLAVVVASLFFGLFFMYRDRGQGRRTVHALTLRVGFSLLLFLILLLGGYLGDLPAGH